MIYEETAFEKQDGWETWFDRETFTQSYSVVNRVMYTETIARIQSDPIAVHDALISPWIWWQNGRMRNYETFSNGRVEFDLWPVRFGVRVRLTLQQPIKTEVGGWKILGEIGGHVVGPISFEIRPQPGGETLLIARFEGTRLNGCLPWLFGPVGFAKRHLGAERGQPGFPFRSGTGFVGLKKKLEFQGFSKVRPSLDFG